MTEDIGRVVGGRYQVVKKIGQGGKGSVFLVMNRSSEHFWAGKKIRSDGRTAAHELEMMKNLHNRHLPAVIDVVPDEDCEWLIMEYIRGIPFDHYIRGGKTLPEVQVLETGIQVADALCYLQKHSPPICHLDIKPENLIRTRDGNVKLVDFGSAWKKDTEQMQEGTDGYAAPEQYDRKAAKDGRTDIYELGATLYRLAAGKKYSRILKESLVPGLGQKLSAVILRCLQEKAGDRYQSPAELKAAFLKVRRSYHRERQKRQLLEVSALALPAAALFCNALPETLDITRSEEWNYGKLLTEARCVPEKESREYYQRAVFAQPKNPEAYFQIVEDAAADGNFSKSEETFLRNILHTVPLGGTATNEEGLMEDPASYGQLSDQIGVLYRYEYEGGEGKRIAAGWFTKAIEAGGRLQEQGADTDQTEKAGEETGEKTKSQAGEPDWLKEARTYSLLSALERPEEGPWDETEGEAGDPDGERAASALRYWECLSEDESFGSREDPLLEIHAGIDTIWQLVFQASDLEDAGVEPAQIMKKAREIRKECMKAAARAGNRKTAEPLISELGDAAETLKDKLA